MRHQGNPAEDGTEAAREDAYMEKMMGSEAFDAMCQDCETHDDVLVNFHNWATKTEAK
tara:strand:+ start:345 stop:518 length:174 start_codon:yes stop_codon:yes gene_type:complete